MDNEGLLRLLDDARDALMSYDPGEVNAVVRRIDSVLGNSYLSDTGLGGSIVRPALPRIPEGGC